MLAAGLLALAVALAVVFGAQTLAWSWGPALLALAAAVLAGLRWRSRTDGAAWALGVALALAVGWILVRAARSPMLDGARADALLVLALAACAWTVAGFRTDGRAMRWLAGGLAVVALGNEIVALVQWSRPEFSWPYSSRPVDSPTGFFGHYNYFSNFTLGVALLGLARLFFSRDPLALKTLYGVVFALGALTIALSGSRGGPLALGVGCFVLLIGTGLVAWRKRSRWSSLVLVATPLLLVLVAAGGWWMLKQAQTTRFGGSGEEVVRIADNTARLEWIQLAMSVASERPITGVGSRAFSWRRNAHWDPEQFGRGTENERFVHNELVQLFTEYGLIGAALVLATVGLAAWRGLAALFLGPAGHEGDADAAAVGLLAAGAAILFQSNISFVFHLLPSTLLLGVFLGIAMQLRVQDARPRRLPAGVAALGGVALALPLGFFGVGSAVALRQIWPVIYTEPSLFARDPATAVARLDAAAEWWPGYRIHGEKGNYARTLATRPELPSADARKWNRVAADSYVEAAGYHPFHPGLRVNAANAWSDLGENQRAEEAYLAAAELQGGLEAAFFAKLAHAQHLYRLWYWKWHNERMAAEALHEFRRARALLEESDALMIWGRREAEPLRESLAEVIGFLEGARVEARPPGETPGD